MTTKWRQLDFQSFPMEIHFLLSSIFLEGLSHGRSLWSCCVERGKRLGHLQGRQIHCQSWQIEFSLALIWVSLNSWGKSCLAMFQIWQMYCGYCTSLMNEINDSWPRCLLLVQALEVGCVKQTGKEFAAWAAFLSPHAALATIFCFFVVASEIGAHHKTHCFLNLAVRYSFSRRASSPDRRWKDGDRYYARPISLILSKILKVADFQLWPNIAYSLYNF